MRYIQLTQRKQTRVDDEDFDMLNQFKWFYNHGYAVRHRGFLKGRSTGIILLHRVIMNTPKGMETDHKSGDTLDNRKKNLRICTRQQNGRNRKLNSNNKSGFRGVSFKNEVNRTKKWRATIKVNGKNKQLGYFLTKEEAARVYRQASLENYGEFGGFRNV